MKRALDAGGFRAFIAILPGDDNVANAEYLREFVHEVRELTNAEQVDLVGFSMGGLSARYYIRFLGGEQEVGRYISIDTPQYGDIAACLLPEEFGGQMCPASSFLAKLNDGDDSPGTVAYTTIVNGQGGGDAGRLRGGSAVIAVRGPHSGLLDDPAVHQEVITTLRDPMHG